MKIIEPCTMILLIIFQNDTNPVNGPLSVTHIPIEIQQGFRRKLFAIFFIQLLFATGLIAFWNYVPHFADHFHRIFSIWYYVVIAMIVMAIFCQISLCTEFCGSFRG